MVRKLGAGGMADVYLCEDLTLGRQVALKVLSSRFAGDAQFVERFRREAKAAARLNHPNIVAIYDWGEIGETYYIVMEYVEGETLKERIRRRGRLNGSEALEIALGLLAAVGYAHRHGVDPPRHQVAEHPARPRRARRRSPTSASPTPATPA